MPAYSTRSLFAANGGRLHCCYLNGLSFGAQVRFVSIVLSLFLVIGDAEAISIEGLAAHGALQAGIVALLILQTALSLFC